jgi:hypothetical protein
VFFAENDKTLFNITNILKQKSMKKKEYERPTMQVVKLKQQPQLLQASVQDYNWNEEVTE